jgi:hypothetical protein
MVLICALAFHPILAQVTYNQATSAVINNVVNPSSDKGDLVAYGFPNMLLGPGDVVGDGDNFDVDTMLQGPTWYFWIDDETNAKFDHPVRHVFVNEQTGAITVKDGHWWPSINNQEVLVSKEERANSPNVVSGTPSPSGAGTTNPPGNTQGAGNTYSNVCIYIISGVDDSKDKWAKTDKDNAENGFKQHFGNNNIDTVLKRNNPTMKQVCDDLENFSKANPACDKFVFYFTGHGAKSYLALRKHKRGNEDRKLTGAKLAAKLSKIKAPIWVVIDACNATDNIQGLKGKISGHAAVSSASCTPSYSSKTTGSYYTKYFMECLNDTAADGPDAGKTISPQEAQKWAENRLNTSGDSDLAGQNSTLTPMAIEIKSGYTEYLGSTQARNIKFVNKSKQPIHDFTITIDGVAGAAIPSNIQGVSVNGDSLDFDVDDNLDGTLGAGENDDTDSSPGKTCKVITKGAANTKAIAPGDTFEIKITLTSPPGSRWCLTIQPTNKAGAAIGIAKSETTGLGEKACVEMSTTLAADAILAPGYNGLSFADVNNTGAPLAELYLVGNNFMILNAMQLDANGDPVPLSNYNPVTGLLSLPALIPPGEDFSFMVIPDFYFDGEPMRLTVCSAPPAQPSLLGVRTISFDQIAFTEDTVPVLTNIFAYTLRYEIPLTGADKYLQILYRPRFEGSSGQMYWAVQNMVLEPFADSMDLTVFLDLDPEDLNKDTITLAELVDIYPLLSDTIMEQGPVLPGPFETVFSSPFHYDFSNGLSLVGNEYPEIPIPIPPGPPHVWENTTSTGVLIGCKMPNIDLDSTKYKPGKNGPYVPSDYAGDKNACAPAGTANSFTWLRSFNPEIEAKLNAAFGEGDSAHRKMLAEFSKLMNRGDEAPAGPDDILKAKLAFADKYKLPMRVSYQSILPARKVNSPDDRYGHHAGDSTNNSGGGGVQFGGITKEFLMRKMKDSCDVELGIIWVKEIDGRKRVTQGHVVTLTGIRKTGNKWTIKFKDDAEQKKPGGTRQHSLPLETAANGSLRLKKLDSDRLGECIIADAFVECYDKSVTFKAVKGKAFRDLDKGGSSAPGYKGFEGLGVELLDPFGFVVATTTTDADGNFWFSDLPGDTSFSIRVPVLPTGWTFSAPNTVDDSIDSDIDPTTGESPPLTFTSLDTAYTLDVGLEPPGLFPLTEDPRVCQVSFSQPIVLPQSNTASMGYTYYLPPGDPLYYLNIMYQPAGTSDTVWLADNFTLEPFEDTMTLSFFFDLDTNATASSTTLPVVEGRFKVFVTDTIIPTVPTVASWDTIPFGLYGYAVANNDIDPPIDFSGLSGITINPPRLPPRSWQTNDTTKGVLIGCKMPNIDLNSDAYNTLFGNGPHVPADYAGDLNACGPAATANSFHWLPGFNPAIGDKLRAAFGEGDSAHRKMMAEMSALMQREDEGMTSIENLIKGKLAFIDKYKLPMKVTYQSMHLSASSVASPNDCYGHAAQNESKVPPQGKPYDKVDPEWIHDRLKDTCDVEMLVAWLVWDPVNMEWTTSRGGHYVTVTGIRQNNGNWRIKWKEDTLQTDEGGLFQGISNIETDARGFLRIPQLDQRDASGTGIAVIANVVAECYDPSVTHTSTKGSASEDSDGDGLQDSGEASIQGQEIWLIDNINGNVQVATTQADGSFVFGDLQPGEYYMELPGLLPGFSLALPNQGTDESLDFDFDLVTLRSPIFSLTEDSVIDFYDLGLVVDTIVRLNMEAWLEGPYDPLGDTMFTKLQAQNLLPLVVPDTFLGLPIDTAFSRPIPIDLPFDPADRVNLCVVQLRDSADSALVVCTRPAMLLNNGELWFIDSILGFTNGIRGIEPGTYWPVLFPPGHLPMMPDQPFLLPPSMPGRDLQLQNVLTLPFGQDDRVTIGGGKRALPAGDTNADGVINVDDRADTWNNRNTTGYKQEDVNYDGAVNVDDRAATWNNRNTVGTVPK